LEGRELVCLPSGAKWGTARVKCQEKGLGDLEGGHTELGKEVSSHGATWKDTEDLGRALSLSPGESWCNATLFRISKSPLYFLMWVFFVVFCFFFVVLWLKPLHQPIFVKGFSR
jgi:hypothetical protein